MFLLFSIPNMKYLTYQEALIAFCLSSRQHNTVKEALRQNLTLLLMSLFCLQVSVLSKNLAVLREKPQQVIGRPSSYSSMILTSVVNGRVR